jgi:alkylhydroperoxidase family enzyme
MTGAPTTSELIDQVLGERDEVIACLHDAHTGAWYAADPMLLELCRLRIAQLLGNDHELAVRTDDVDVPPPMLDSLAQWATSPAFGPRERAVLAFCEQFVIDVASLGPELRDAVAEHLGADETALFANALLVIEQRQRLRLMWERLELI